MALRKILQYPEDEKLLRQKSLAVQKVDKRIRKLVRDLKDTLEDSFGAGLAAPQIGVHERVALVKFGQEAEGGMREPITLINPQIISTGPDEKGFDGCLSIPGVVTWDTLRPSPLVFSALDEKGETFQMEVSGIDARVVHHEIDHLDGILFLDRIKDLNKVYRSIETEDGEKLISLASLKAKIEKEIFNTPLEKVLTKTR